MEFHQQTSSRFLISSIVRRKEIMSGQELGLDWPISRGFVEALQGAIIGSKSRR